MASPFDTHNNLAYSTVQGGGVVSSTTGTTILLNASDGTRFSTGQNITVWPSGVNPSFGGGGVLSNAEIMRITNIVGDTLTVTRGQESSALQGNIAVNYQVANTDTAKVFTDIEAFLLNNKLNIPNPNGVAGAAGTGTLSSGTVTISTTAVTANSLIFLTDTAASLTNVGTLSVSSKSAGVSFTVTSANALDTSTFNWLLVN